MRTRSLRIALMFLIFVVRALITGAFQAAYVYTPEVQQSHYRISFFLSFLVSKVYPTAVRAVGLGMCSTIARLGAMITPFIAQVLVSAARFYVLDFCLKGAASNKYSRWRRHLRWRLPNGYCLCFVTAYRDDGKRHAGWSSSLFRKPALVGMISSIG